MKSLCILLLTVTLVIGNSIDNPQSIENLPGHVSATPTTVVEVLMAKNLTVMAKLIANTGLTKTLMGKGPFTVFAPSNAAILQLPIVVRDRLVSDLEYAVDFVKYHILDTNLNSSAMTNDEVVKTENNKTIRFNIYKISDETVLLANGAKLVDDDLMAKNGIVHILQKPLWPQAVFNILELTSHNKYLTTFGAAVNSSKVNLAGKGPFTVFVPSNEAFKAYSGKKDVDMVNYHVIDGTFYSGGMTDKMDLTTQLKHITGYRKLTIHKDKENRISVQGKNTAKATTVDLPATNGVVFILDTVLVHPFF